MAAAREMSGGRESLRALAAAALVPALAAVLVACGSGQATGTSSATPSVALSTSHSASSSAASPANPTASAARSPASPAPPSAALPGRRRAAAAALAGFNRAFLQVAGGKGYYRMSTAGGNVTFFKQAELIEMTQDAWVNSREPKYKRLMAVLFGGLMRHSPTLGAWLSHTNDDILWASVMCLRAYRITGDKSYVRLARQAFDATYARCHDGALGGGLWGSDKHKAKNTCVALPAAVAAAMLYQDVHVKSYRAKAIQLYAWVRANLYDAQTGAVWDHLTPRAAGGSTVDRTTWTYNQGIFIGASDLLYQVTGKRRCLRDALRTLAFTRASLTVNGILTSEVAPRSPLWVSAGGYKGMFVRWAETYIRRYHVQGYADWFRQNAAEALKHANAAGLMNEDWSRPTGGGDLSAFSCSSAVVLLQWVR